MKRFLSIFLSLILVFSIFFTTNITLANADVTVAGSFSNVLDDLATDVNFDATQFKKDPKDPSLDLITIAESNDDELFVYVHQPSGENLKLRASKIKISTEEDSLDYKVYDLLFINCSGVFYKYLVKDFTVKDTDVRYYDITTIHRPYDSSLDLKNTNIDDSQTINHVYYKVAKLFTFTNNSMLLEDTETITITSKYCGFIRCKEGFYFFDSYSVDLHFVAFSTDKIIDDLLEADVYYEQQFLSETTSYASFSVETFTSYGDIEKEHKHLTKNDEFTTSGRGWLSEDYKYKTIFSSNAFLSSNFYNINDMFDVASFNSTFSNEKALSTESKNAIKNTSYVLVFCQTNYDFKSIVSEDTTSITEKKYIVSNVSLLRLKFETKGITYNLGVLDNFQSGDIIPDGFYENNKIESLLYIILFIIFIVFLALILSFLTPVLSFIWSLIKFVFKILLFPLNLLFNKKNKNSS